MVERSFSPNIILYYKTTRCAMSARQWSSIIYNSYTTVHVISMRNRKPVLLLPFGLSHPPSCVYVCTCVFVSVNVFLRSTVKGAERLLELGGDLLIEVDLFNQMVLDRLVHVDLAFRLEVGVLGAKRPSDHVRPVVELAQLLRFHLVLAHQPLAILSLLHRALYQNKIVNISIKKSKRK